MHQGFPHLPIFCIQYCHKASTVIPLLPKATFTTSIQRMHGQIGMVLIHSFQSVCTNSIFWSHLLALSIQDYLCTASYQTLSIHDTFIKFLKHFTSRTLTSLPSALLIPHASAPYSTIGTITSSHLFPILIVQQTF